jgi:hypothetical protein
MLDRQQAQRKPLTPYQRAQAIELRASGMSYKSIALQLGYSSDVIIRQLFIAKKKSKPVAATKPASTTTIHHVSSVPMRRRHYFPLLDHVPTRNELLAMLHDAVANTKER